MKIVRFKTGRKTSYGLVKGNTVHEIKGSPFRVSVSAIEQLATGRTFDLKNVKLLAPCQPSKLVCLGLNYRLHASETSMEVPGEPLIFIKPSTAVIGPEDEIVVPRTARRVDYEVELGVVIGKKAKDVPEAKVKDFILGYTCVNDVTERTFQKSDGQWTRAKGFDTFAPVGPWIVTGIDPGNLKVESYLNGAPCQSGNTSDLIHPIAKLVAFISSVMTLLPGDIIATGTPGGTAMPDGRGRMNAGDTIELVIEKVGTLRNRVVAARS